MLEGSQQVVAIISAPTRGCQLEKAVRKGMALKDPFLLSRGVVFRPEGTRALLGKPPRGGGVRQTHPDGHP